MVDVHKATPRNRCVSPLSFFIARLYLDRLHHGKWTEGPEARADNLGTSVVA